jgi:hypothetical protein
MKMHKKGSSSMTKKDKRLLTEFKEKKLDQDNHHKVKH